MAGGPAPAAAAPARPGAPENIEKLGKPHPVYFETIPEAKRMTRDQYIKVANYYFAGLAHNDGIPSEANGFYPFADECVRFENGSITTIRTTKNLTSSSIMARSQIPLLELAARGDYK